MATGFAFRRNADTDASLVGPGRAANTNDDVLTFDLSGFKEGYGFYTASFADDSAGGYRGTYYLDGNTRFDFVSIERFNITGTDYADSIQTGNGNDVIKAGAGNDVVVAGAGKDTLEGGTGIDGFNKTFSGAAGVSVNLQASTITASQGTIKGFEYFAGQVGSSGADTFVSSQARGDDSVNGGEGNDRVEFKIGRDAFTGGGGNDTLKTDESAYAGGEGISTAFDVDAAGGYRGYYYVNGAQRVDFLTTENFEVLGTKNNDTIYAGNGNDILSGNAGNDDIRSGAGKDTLDGGDGTDGLGRDLTNGSVAISINLKTSAMTAAFGTIAGFEYFSNVIGSTAADTFVSTTSQANDTITGGGGNDTVSFYEGADRFAGGLGTDKLIVDYSTQNTNAGISTGFGADAGGGSAGSFYVDGNTRTDFTSVEAFAVTGTQFNDQITTGDGDDVVTGGTGWDVISSGLGQDTLDGGTGQDGLGRVFSTSNVNVTINLQTSTITAAFGTIAGFEYFANVVGGNGNDTFVTTTALADDAVIGGGGNDTFTVYEGYDRFTGGQGGNDRLIVDYSAQFTNKGIEMSFTQDVQNGGWQGYYYVDGNTRVDFSSVEVFTVTGTQYDDRIITGDGDDTINAGAGWDFVTAGAGADVLDGGAGIDGLGRNFATSTDDIGANLITNAVSGMGGSMTNFEYFAGFVTGDGNDTLVSTATAANDTVNLGSGDDTFTSYNGADSYTAGQGNDRLIVDWSAIDVFGGITNAPQTLDTNGGYFGSFSIDSGPRVDFASVEAFTITGTKYGDLLVGKEGDDIFTGGAGDDRIYAGSGDDKASGGDGIDGLQKDMQGATAAITVNLETDTLSLRGSSISDIEYFLDLRTGDGADKITTGHLLLNDLVWGYDGNDTATFFGGADTFNAGAGAKDTVIVDYSGLDTEDAVSTSIGVDNDNGGFRGYFYVNGAARTDFTGAEVFQVTGTKNNDTITGADFGDTLVGGDGRDTLNGGGGGDTLNGGAAADTLNGGTGIDTLDGGAGGDTLSGGAQADTFLFDAGDVNTNLNYVDRITDFETGIDTIDLAGIDANATTAGNQAFAFVGSGAFTAAGQLHVVNIGGFTYVQGNVDADLGADFSIRVDATAPVVDDFKL